VDVFRALSGERASGEALATLDTGVVADAESALTDELREQPARAAGASKNRAGNFVMEPER
jgi:hypothetical protein